MRKIFVILLFSTWVTAYSQMNLPTILLYKHSSKVAAYKALCNQSFIQCGCKSNFCTKELMDKHIDLGIVKNRDAFTCHISHYGYTLFGELELQMGYARCFGSKLAMALQAIYLMQHATHYECRHSFTVDLSLAYNISHNLLLSIDIYNPIRMKYGITSNEIIPMEFFFQANYRQNDKLSATIFCQKTLPGNMDVGLEIGYSPLSSLIITSNASIYKCGIGILIPWKKFLFSIQSDWYYRISFSPESNILFVY